MEEGSIRTEHTHPREQLEAMKYHPFCFTAEVPLETLVKKYAGAYAEGFEWPRPASLSEDEERDEADEGTAMAPHHP